MYLVLVTNSTTPLLLLQIFDRTSFIEEDDWTKHKKDAAASQGILEQFLVWVLSSALRGCTSIKTVQL
jgi:hypothetical protein